jgi:hypothetical protein
LSEQHADGLSVRHEYRLDDGGRANYVLFDRRRRGLAVPSRIIFRASAPTAPFAPIAGFKTRSTSPTGESH